MLSLPMIHRPPTEEEERGFLDFFKLYFVKPGYEVTIPTSDETERTLCEWYKLKAFSTCSGSTSKDYFDGYTDESAGTYVGWQSKQKKLSAHKFSDVFSGTGQGVMELTNAEAFLWECLKTEGLKRGHFEDHKHPKKMGNALLGALAQQREAAPEQSSTRRHNGNRCMKLDMENSVFINVLWCKNNASIRTFRCVLVSFDLVYPEQGSLRWGYNGRALVGENGSGDKIITFYGASGGQVQYCPKIQCKRYRSQAMDVSV